MKKIFLSIVIGFSCSYGMSQRYLSHSHIGISFGQAMTNFTFIDSDGNKADDLKFVARNSVNFNYSYSIKNQHLLRAEIGYRGAGSRANYFDFDTEWKLNYADFGGAYFFNILSNDKLFLAPGIGINASFLISGEQNIGPHKFDVRESKAFKSMDLTASAVTHFRAMLTNDVWFSFEYRFGYGIFNIENDVTEQTTRNLSHCALIGIGLQF